MQKVPKSCHDAPSRTVADPNREINSDGWGSDSKRFYCILTKFIVNNHGSKVQKSTVCNSRSKKCFFSVVQVLGATVLYNRVSRFSTFFLHFQTEYTVAKVGDKPPKSWEKVKQNCFWCTGLKRGSHGIWLTTNFFDPQVTYDSKSDDLRAGGHLIILSLIYTIFL
jgi:hypothetical protein